MVSDAGGIRRGDPVQMKALLSDETVANVRKGSGEVRQFIQELQAAVQEQRQDLLALTKSLRSSAERLQPVATGPELQRTVKRIDALTECWTAAAAPWIARRAR
jgi:hypothetical protein